MAALFISLSNPFRGYEFSRGNGEQAHGLVNLANAAISVTYRRDGTLKTAFKSAVLMEKKGENK